MKLIRILKARYKIYSIKLRKELDYCPSIDYCFNLFLRVRIFMILSQKKKKQLFALKCQKFFPNPCTISLRLPPDRSILLRDHGVVWVAVQTDIMIIFLKSEEELD